MPFDEAQFRERLKSLGEKFGSLARLERRCDIAGGLISRYISGERDPQLATVVKIAEGAGVGLDWLLGPEETRQIRAFSRRALTKQDTSVGIIAGVDVDLLVCILSTLGGERFWSTESVEERARIASEVYERFKEEEKEEEETGLKRPSRAQILKLVRGGRRS